MYFCFFDIYSLFVVANSLSFSYPFLTRDFNLNHKNKFKIGNTLIPASLSHRRMMNESAFAFVAVNNNKKNNNNKNWIINSTLKNR